MQTDTVEDGLSRRLAALSPERRAILQRLMQANAADASPLDEIPVQPRTGRRDFPLSAAQERMWFNHQWSPDQPLYNESFGLILRGALDPHLLEKSFDILMARHEIFSVTFHSAEGGFVQRVGSALVPRMEVRDLRPMRESEREAIYESESRRLLRETFQLDRGPLFRAGLWTLGRTEGRACADEDEHRLIFVMHHIIFDGWSGGIFLRELLTSYTAMAEGRTPNLPPLRAQYVDFAVWEQRRAEEFPAALDGQLEYWRRQLDGIPEPPALPVDRHLPDSCPHIQGREVFLCDKASTEALKILAKESGATLFMLLLAAFKLLLARYSRQEDIVVGIPTTNRNHSDLRDMVGVFINTAILRTDLSGDPTFRELLGRIRQTTMDAQENQEAPLQRVLRLLNSNEDPGHSLIRVLFDLQRKPAWLFHTPGLSIEPMEVTNGVAKFDLVLALEDTDLELKGILDYDAEKFEAATARQLVRHYLALIRSAVAQPDTPVSRLPLLTTDLAPKKDGEDTGEDTDGELARSEGHGADTSDHLHPLACAEILASAAEHPEALAVADGRASTSYRQLHVRAMHLAGLLQRHNVGRGEHVVLLLPSGLDLVTAQLAVMMMGAAFAPIDPEYPEARVDFMIRDCGARFAIVNREGRHRLPEYVTSIECNRNWPASVPAKSLSFPIQRGSDPAYLIYTSGSTGQPKGVSVSHAALANLIAWHRRRFAITCRDRGTQIASVAFDASIWEIWPYLAAGASVHFPPKDLVADPAGMRDWLIKHKITIGFVPTQLAEELIALRWPSSATLRYLLTGGDRLRKSPAAGLPFALVNNYGPTENAVVTTSGLITASGRETPAIGRPIDNVWVRIVDRGLQPVPLGAAGELIVGGLSLANGYWNQPALTSEKFVTLANGERAYRTGDLCRFRRDGEVEFLGRIDTQVKLRGCRIELGEIESALLAHEGVHDAAAEMREIGDGRHSIVAYVIAKGQPLAPEMLRSFLLGRLPSYMVPSNFVRIDSLPRMLNGKLDRKKLPSPDPEAQSNEPQILPSTVTEIEIAALWKTLLKIESVAVTDNFFALGGDSLLATRLATGIRDKFAVELPLVQMMGSPTIRALATFIDGPRCAADELPDGLVPLRSQSRGESLPPLFLSPPASGSPACYLALAAALPEEGAVYGFEAAGLSKGEPVASVIAQARQYVAALESIYPHGPCFIAGWSLGGPVAFEMSCQLREAGREVAYLGLIDAGLPEDGRLPGGASMMVPLWWAVSYPFVERIPLNYRTVRMLAQWMGISLPESPLDIWRRGPKAGSRFAAGLLENARRSLQVFLASMKAFRSYQPRFFDGEVTLFRTAQGRNLDNGRDVSLQSLRRWCRHVDVHEAPGSHMTLMLDPELSAAFAVSFAATLEAAQQRTKLVNA